MSKPYRDPLARGKRAFLGMTRAQQIEARRWVECMVTVESESDPEARRELVRQYREVGIFDDDDLEHFKRSEHKKSLKKSLRAGPARPR